MLSTGIEAAGSSCDVLSSYYWIYAERFTTVSSELGKCKRKQLWKSLNLQMSSVSVGLQLPDISMSNTLSEAAVIYAGAFVTREQPDREKNKTGKQETREEKRKLVACLPILCVKDRFLIIYWLY